MVVCIVCTLHRGASFFFLRKISYCLSVKKMMSVCASFSVYFTDFHSVHLDYSSPDPNVHLFGLPWPFVTRLPLPSSYTITLLNDSGSCQNHLPFTTVLPIYWVILYFYLYLFIFRELQDCKFRKHILLLISTTRFSLYVSVGCCGSNATLDTCKTSCRKDFSFKNK